VNDVAKKFCDVCLQAKSKSDAAHKATAATAVKGKRTSKDVDVVELDDDDDDVDCWL
jgi:hypothetical protein